MFFKDSAKGSNCLGAESVSIKYSPRLNKIENAARLRREALHGPLPSKKQIKEASQGQILALSRFQCDCPFCCPLLT
jgi:hypothetical protein